MSTKRLARSIVVLASCALAAAAEASYAQMRLDGIGIFLALSLLAIWTAIVDIGLMVKLFRRRSILMGSLVLSFAVIALVFAAFASPSERTGFFKGSPGGAMLVIVIVTCIAFVPFIFLAPFAQYAAMQDDRRWPRWVPVWIVLQFLLLPLFIALDFADDYFWKREYAVGEAIGSAVQPGGLAGVLELADRQHERIWGTPFHLPWPPSTQSGVYPRISGWSAGMVKGLGSSVLFAGNDPMGASDRAALVQLTSRHLQFFSKPAIDARMLWDRLEPGNFTNVLMAGGELNPNVAPAETIPPLLERFEKYAEPRMCPDGRMLDQDRATLLKLVEKRGETWSTETRKHSLRSDWAEFPARIERLCRRAG